MTHEALHSTSAMLDLLTQWRTLGWLRELDLAFVRFLHEESPQAPAALLLASALVSHQLGRGHVCLDLQSVPDQPADTLALPPDRHLDALAPTVDLPEHVLQGWTLTAWCQQLQYPDLVDSGSGRAPLVLMGHRLYLRRYWCLERDVERAIQDRMRTPDNLATDGPNDLVRTTLDTLFPATAPSTVDWQKMACAVAARSAFSVITGGPGTGKTTTVVRLLGLLQRLALAQAPHRPLVIRLAAPTGKAAARLKQSIRHAIHQLPGEHPEDVAAREHIPTEVSTLHRLLGTLADSRLFRHDARYPLALDVLVIDEASMVDLEMMAATLQALPPNARLILLGDKDQLASVEAGSVLGELCRRAREGHYRPETAQWLQSLTGQHLPDALQDPQGPALDQHIVMLRHSHRFDASSGIGQLAAAVNAGDDRAVQQVLSESHPDVLEHHWPALDDERLQALVLPPLNQGAAPPGLSHYLHIMRTQRPALEADPAEWDAWALRVLAAHGRFQLLCALRNGPSGVQGLNPRIQAILTQQRLIEATSEWYAGRPVIVTRNDYALGLMNGDVGIALPYPQRHRAQTTLDWGLRVAFPTHDDTRPIHWVLPSRLTAVDTVYALTVHKSQGSEFEHVALLLPPERTPVLTRELIYTAITRAKSWFSLVGIGHPRLLQQACRHTVQRSGGLFDPGTPG
jgi:exodeoxyribonuclease V alpha subunit